MSYKILCVDFDGVIHSYTSGWEGAAVVKDPPVPGAIRWLVSMAKEPGYAIAVYSSRSKEPGGIEAMKEWLEKYVNEYLEVDFNTFVSAIQFPTEKPAAYLTIDDRAICFRGTFPSLLEMENFKPWNK